MLTVLEAAERAGRNPETVRRWIRAGRLRSRGVGREHLIAEDDLEALLEGAEEWTPPGGWGTLPSGRPAPNWAYWVRVDREEH